MQNNSMTFVTVTPQIILGSCPETIADVDKLSDQLKVTAVLNLQTDEDMQFLELNWSVINRQYVRKKMQLRRISIVDFDRADLRDHLPRALDALHALVRSGKIIYVHCTAGASRAPTVVVAYLYWFMGKELFEAANHVMSIRSCSPDTETIARASAHFTQKQNTLK